MPRDLKGHILVSKPQLCTHKGCGCTSLGICPSLTPLSHLRASTSHASLPFPNFIQNQEQGEPRSPGQGAKLLIKTLPLRGGPSLPPSGCCHPQLPVGVHPVGAKRALRIFSKALISAHSLTVLTDDFRGCISLQKLGWGPQASDCRLRTPGEMALLLTSSLSFLDTSSSFSSLKSLAPSRKEEDCFMRSLQITDEHVDIIEATEEARAHTVSY